MTIPAHVTCQATRCETPPAPATARFHYSAYGFAIASDVPLPQLAPAAPAEADLTVGLGEVAEGVISRPGFRRGVIKGQFRYQLEAGQRITIEPLPGSRPDNVSDGIMSRVLTAAAYQRGLLPLHASAVATAAGVVALCGPSGAGKSTLAAVMAARGAQLIADDMVALGEDGHVAGRGAAGCKLSVPSLAKLGLTAHGLALANSVERKFFLPLADTSQGCGRIATLVQLRKGPMAIEPLTPLAAGAAWRACIRMPELMNEAPDQRAIWRRWLDLVLGAANLSIAHGGRMESLEAIAHYLEHYQEQP
jgi:hypothetical protein